MAWPGSFVNWQVGVYLLLVIGTQILVPAYFGWQRKSVARRRAEAGLPDGVMLNAAERLSQVRWESGLQGGLLLITIFLVPLVLIAWTAPPPEVEGGLFAIFVAIVVWLLTQGTDVFKAFLGGLAFKTLVAFQHSIQVGDRVTLKGQGGKVIKIGVFFVTLQTPDDDLINIPTRELWSDVLSSANAGDRASLCVMQFYLAPFATQAQRQGAEDAIWDGIQASTFCDPAKPMQIFLAQEPNAIHLTAKAYVSSTYNTPLFMSDVTRAFLDYAANTATPLASEHWRQQPPVDEPATPAPMRAAG